ncbi:MAG: hypothetical protein KIT39_13615 [Nitrospirales bacterium]|nr:hypothetical protein [Nitrospirales bacterium]
MGSKDSEDDQHTIKKFGAEISGLTSSLGGGMLDAHLQSALKKIIRALEMSVAFMH